MPVELRVPKVGESITEVEIGEWLKAVGEPAKQDETIVMLDTAKTTVELPAPVAGTVTQILKQSGETAEVGELIGYMEEGGAATSTALSSSSAAVSHSSQQPAQAEKPAAPDVGAAPAREVAEQNGGETRVMPAAQRVLAEHGLRAEQVEASGPGGRVLKEDVMRQVEGRAQPAETKPEPAPSPIEHPAPAQPAGQKPAVAPTAAPAPQAAAPGEEEVVPMSLLRRHIAQRLVEAQQTAALLTTFNEIDMSAVMALRKEHQESFTKHYNIKLGFMSFFVKACVDGLRQFPAINAEIRGKDIIYRNYFDIGVAIGSGKGLVVPVLRRAERMGFAEIEQAIADLGKRARDNALKPDELLGGTFTITNGGIYGSLLSTPIVNPPQSGILGMHAIQERPVARGGQIVIRPMMYIALTYDHRIVDGREAVTFLKRVAECIENPARMLIEV
jgi:2-oxoglutarate dehydrogenase E2 component (dihydrolipoamide succinyltransferase)